MRKQLGIMMAAVAIFAALLAGCSKFQNDVTGPGAPGTDNLILKKGGGGKPGPPADPALAYTITGTVSHVIVTNDDGSHGAKVYSTPRFAIPPSNPSWSPDGGSIAFKGGSSGSELWRVDVRVVDGEPQGENPTLLLDHIIGGPEWSPGGMYENHILFTASPQTQLQVISALPGGTPEVLYTAETGHSVWYPAWSPDGDSIAFLEWNGDQYLFRVLDVASGTASTVPLQELLPAGGRMALDWARTRSSHQLAYGGGGEVYTIDIESGEATFLLQGRTPSWSPDDSRLVCADVLHGSVATYELETGEIQKLVGGGYWPDWRRF